MVIGWLIKMASAKQIAWRKKFARMSKAGKFKKAKSKTKLLKQQREPTRSEFKKAGYTKKEIDEFYAKKMNVKKFYDRDV